MKTFAICLCVSLGTAFPALAFEKDPLRTFANCAGRLSAVMEYQWMFDGAASETTQSQRSNLIALIRAIMDDGEGRQVLQWRLEAKQAQSMLLTRATFNDDAHDAAWARAQATHYQQSCISLLLS